MFCHLVEDETCAHDVVWWERARGHVTVFMQKMRRLDLRFGLIQLPINLRDGHVFASQALRPGWLLYFP